MQYHASDGPLVPSYDKPAPMTAGADARNGALKQVLVTLTTANTAYAVVLPITARGFVLYPSVADTYFAIGENPVAQGAIVGNVVAANFTVGATAPFGLQTVRVLDDATAAAGASLRLFSATANANVVVSIF
jgi:hypothetical protein